MTATQGYLKIAITYCMKQTNKPNFSQSWSL